MQEDWAEELVLDCHKACARFRPQKPKVTGTGCHTSTAFVPLAIQQNYKLNETPNAAVILQDRIHTGGDSEVYWASPEVIQPIPSGMPSAAAEMHSWRSHQGLA